jgi:hypothetical protein
MAAPAGSAYRSRIAPAPSPAAGATAMPNRTVLVSFLASVLACTSHAYAGGATTRYFDLVNASHDSVTSVAVAPAGDSTFHEIDLGAPLRGGVTSATVEIPEGDCARDFRLVFADGRTLVYPGVDVCRYRQMRLTQRDGRSSPITADQALVRAP